MTNGKAESRFTFWEHKAKRIKYNLIGHNIKYYAFFFLKVI